MVTARAWTRVETVRNGPQWGEDAAEKEKEKERVFAKDGASSLKREGGGRRKEDDARVRGETRKRTQQRRKQKEHCCLRISKFTSMVSYFLIMSWHA